jgi:two-component system sensor histidine kinase AlgZ
MLAQIGEFLRTILDCDAAAETPLSQEIAFTEQYLAIEQTRLGPRLRVDIDICPETLDALVPSLLLQPLIENAVRHGVAPMLEGGTIRIESKFHGGDLQIRVRNSAPARSSLAPSGESSNGSGSGVGVGISNTAERLQTLYGDDHKFVLQWPEAGGCEVTVELPFRKSKTMQPQEAASCAR